MDVSGQFVGQVVPDRHLYGKHRTLAGLGVHVDRMAEQVGQTLNDRKTKAEATRALAGRIVELVELLEDRLNLLFGDADAGVPYLDAQLVAPAPAAEQDLASLR